MTRVFITGANGYLGNAIANRLQRSGLNVTRGLRKAPPDPVPADTTTAIHGDLQNNPPWPKLLDGHDAVVHCAGPAHVDDSDPDLARAAITQATQNLAQAAANLGILRFIFISSAHVMGLTSEPGHPFTEDNDPTPQTEYARAKLNAEHHLHEIAARSAMQIIIVRPPMVYGPHCPGNFARLVRLVRTGFPLPLGYATAHRSFISIDNLTSAISTALNHPRNNTGTYIISDNESCSTANLVRLIANASNKSTRLVPIPHSIVRTLARLTGRTREIDRLLSPCELSNAKFCDTFSWQPEETLDHGITNAVRNID